MRNLLALGQPAGDGERACGLAFEPDAHGAQSAQDERGIIGRNDMAKLLRAQT